MFGQSALERKKELVRKSDRLREELAADALMAGRASTWLDWGASAAQAAISHRKLIFWLLGVTTAWAFRSLRRQSSSQAVAADVEKKDYCPSKTEKMVKYGQKAAEAWRTFQRARNAWAQWKQGREGGRVSRNLVK
ncbi:MAG: hypothetical protein V1746_05625 [bacterium]